MVIVNIKKEDSKKAFKKEAVFKVPKIKGYPTIRIEKGCDFQRNTNFSYSSQPHCIYNKFIRKKVKKCKRKTKSHLA